MPAHELSYYKRYLGACPQENLGTLPSENKYESDFRSLSQ